MRMQAAVVEDSGGLVTAKKAYDTSFFAHPFAHEQFLGACPQRMYKATILKAWRNASAHKAGHYIDVRRRITLAAPE
jgi:hypothetical protein